MIFLLFISICAMFYGIKHRKRALIISAAASIFYCLFSALAQIPTWMSYAPIFSAANHTILAILIALFARIVISEGDDGNE